MDDRQQWKRSRYASWAAVVTLHIAVLTAIFLAPKTRIATPTAMAPTELLTLPRSVRRQGPIPAPSLVTPDLQVRPLPLPPMTPSDAIAEIPAADGNDSGTTIDWVQAALDAAARFAERGNNEPTAAEPTAISPFPRAAPHHKGEQIPTAEGRSMVFVSENCYQLSKEITYIENKTNAGKKIQIYCNRRSKTPRGDLFEQLPAYKRLHPDEQR
jgi:hypothetical protein